MKKEGKLIVFSAPSGSGKTTIVHYLLKQLELNLDFSISATSRNNRHPAAATREGPPSWPHCDSRIEPLRPEFCRARPRAASGVPTAPTISRTSERAV